MHCILYHDVQLVSALLTKLDSQPELSLADNKTHCWITYLTFSVHRAISICYAVILSIRISVIVYSPYFKFGFFCGHMIINHMTLICGPFVTYGYKEYTFFAMLKKTTL